MNRVILIGRMTRDAELRHTSQGTPVASFTLAVNRRFKNNSDGPDADFIPIVVWGKQGENVARYVGKGNQVAVSGRIQTRNYQAKDGTKRYITEVIADEVEFLGSKRDSHKPNDEFNQDFGVPLEDFHPIEEDDDDLPF